VSARPLRVVPTVRVERSRHRFVLPRAPGSPDVVVHEYDAERASAQDVDGGVQRLAGCPPAFAGPRLPPPPAMPPAAVVAQALSELLHGWNGRLQAEYSCVRSVRRTVSGAGPTPLRSAASWSLTARLLPAATSPGFWLTWSGRGCGSAWLRQRAAREVGLLADGLARAEPLEPTVVPTVLAPAAAAVVLHEAIGHLAEAADDPDPVGRRLLGCRVAGPAITVVDDPLVPGAAAHYVYDDDNVRSLGATPVVTRGILVGRLHSQTSAAAAGALPTANGRAASGWDPPVPRVSNLVCSGGTSTPPALLAAVGRGVYVRRLANGVNNGAGIEAEVVLAEEIADGRLTGRWLTGGHVREGLGVLRRVLDVARDPAFAPNAVCGRAGQVLFDVGTQAPSLLLSSMRFAA
jgi:TldD protein